MKKSLIAITTFITVSTVCSSVFAADIDTSIKLGYNLANSNTTSNSVLDVYGQNALISQTITATGDGGFVICVDADADITNNLGINASINAEYMTKELIDNEFLNFNSITSSSNEVNMLKKWTLSADALVTYNLVKSVSGLKAGVQGGINFVSTNIADAIIRKSALADVINGISEKCDSNGGSLVVGAFLDYNLNNKIKFSADGYMGFVGYGDVVSPFNNYKINAEISYEIINNLNIVGGFTFAKNVVSKDFSDFDLLDSNLFRGTINYSYIQFMPLLGVNYSF